MTETELERIVVRYVGDATQYMRTNDEMIRSAVASGKAMEGAMAPATHAAAGMHMQMRQTAHSIHILATVTGLHEISGPALMGAHAYHILHGVVERTVESMGALKATVMFTGVGAAIAGIAVLVNWWEHATEVQNKAAAATVKAMDALIAGSKSVKEALADVGVEAFAEKFKESFNQFATGGSTWDRIKESFRAAWRFGSVPVTAGQQARAVEMMGEMRLEDLQHNMETALRIQEMSEQLFERMTQNPVVQRALERTGFGQAGRRVEAEMDKIEERINRFRLGEAGAGRESLLERFIRGTPGMTRERAEELLGPALRDLEHMQIRGSLTDIDLQIRALNEEAAAVGLSANEHRRRAIALDYAHRFNITLQEAEERLAVRLDRASAAMERRAKAEAALAVRANLAKNLNDASEALKGVERSLESQVAVLGMTADQARVYGGALEYARRVGISVTEAFDRMGSTFERQRELLDRLAAARIFEETRSPVERFAVRIDELDGLLARGRISMDTYARAVAGAEKSLLGAGAASGAFQHAAAGSVEAIGRITAYREGLQSALPTMRGAVEVALAGRAGAVELQRPMEAAVPILKQIRDILAGRNQPPQAGTKLTIANFQGV